jgi:hypothetical protein
MPNWVGHRLTITGPEKELKRFARCFVTAKGGELFTQYFIDKHCDGRPLERPVGELYFDFDKLGPAKPEDSDKWVLNRWGIKWVACQGKIEVAAGEIKLAWESGWAPALEVYAELAELFPLLTMEGAIPNMGSVSPATFAAMAVSLPTSTRARSSKRRWTRGTPQWQKSMMISSTQTF